MFTPICSPLSKSEGTIISTISNNLKRKSLILAMDKMSLVANIITFLSFLFSILAWYKARQVHGFLEAEKTRHNKKIRVILRNGEKTIELPIEIRREELTRSEILGRIGMIPMNEKGKRFTIEYLNAPEFFQQINTLKDNYGEGILEIRCSPNELKQFKV